MPTTDRRARNVARLMPVTFLCAIVCLVAGCETRRDVIPMQPAIPAHAPATPQLQPMEFRLPNGLEVFVLEDHQVRS